MLIRRSQYFLCKKAENLLKYFISCYIIVSERSDNMPNFFSSNLKFLRENKGISQNKLGSMVGVNQTTIARWETKEINPSIDNVEQIANALNVNLPDLLITDLRFDNASIVDVSSNTIKIPVLGTIKAGIAIEAQQDIVEYIEIPKEWTKGDKSFYGLKISGDSMYPKYQENDIVIFEKTDDFIKANKKDCAVMVNGFDATFKNITITDSGITLVPLNLNNQDNYQPTFYDKTQIEELPVKIIGIAKEKRTRL